MRTFALPAEHTMSHTGALGSRPPGAPSERNTMTTFLDPSDNNALRFIERRIEGPLTMMNLLRFRDWADYSATPELAPAEPISGSAAYDLYVRHTVPFLVASGGSVEFFGTGGALFVGPEDERWDLVMLIRQASVDDFFAYASNEAYMAGVGHRTAAVEDARMLPLVARALP
ncbi:MAG: hypothetical protein QOI71_1604 [Gaiellales bacterium]|nr:hypothetical protein [Gaiellales bacterium]